MAETISLIPSAYKSGRILLTKPANANGTFNYSRSGGKATRIDSNGLLQDVEADIPIIDYSDGSCPVLLLNESSTNYFKYSEDLENSNWNDPSNKFDLLDEYTDSPRGGVCKVFNLTETNVTFRFTGFSLDAGTYNMSFWFKDIDGGITSGGVDIGDEDTGNTTPLLNEVGSKWVRVNRTMTITETKSFADIRLDFNGSSNRVGIWGIQIEPKSYMSSYIPTLNGIVETRIGCSSSKQPLTQYINSKEGSIVIESASLVDDSSFKTFRIKKGSSNTELIFYYSSDNQLGAVQYRINGVDAQGSASFVIPNNLQINLFVITYTQTELKIYLNKELKVSTTLSDSFELNDLDNIVLPQKVKVKRFAVHDKALTQKEIDEL